ncbi:MAG: beta-propeller fold lactonase family protein [Terracidiphilus sp.]|nr:beta-propeller fold lactonase family protein [Terracidiphilus sp.]
MKFSKLSQLFLVSTIGLLVATLLTACQLVTIDYLFVASSAGSGSGSAGQIQTYAVDSQTGVVRTAAPTVASGGVGPIAMAVTSDYANLYIANQGNNSVVHFTIAGNGVLTSKDTLTTSTVPVSLAVSTDNKYLYVATGSSSATLTEYALSSGTIGASVAQISLVVPGYTGDTIVPTGVNVLVKSSALTTPSAVYVTAYDKSAYNPGGTITSIANSGWVFGFAIGSGGALTAATGSPYQAGVKPSGIASDPAGRFVYVTDYASNELIGYTVQGGSVLDSMVNGPFKTANEPSAICIDPRGSFIYVSDALSSVISAYAITLATGTPSTLSYTTGAAATDTYPVAIIVEPALGRFVYTANQLGNSVSGLRLDPTAGTLTETMATPYPTGNAPTALIAVPHGNHSVQSVTP